MHLWFHKIFINKFNTIVVHGLVSDLFKRIDRIQISFHVKDRQLFLELYQFGVFRKSVFNPFFSDYFDSFDYVIILLNPPTHLVRKRNHLAIPTHPLF